MSVFFALVILQTHLPIPAETIAHTSCLKIGRIPKDQGILSARSSPRSAREAERALRPSVILEPSIEFVCGKLHTIASESGYRRVENDRNLSMALREIDGAGTRDMTRTRFFCGDGPRKEPLPLMLSDTFQLNLTFRVYQHCNTP